MFTYGGKRPAIDLQISLGTCGKKKNEEKFAWLVNLASVILFLQRISLLLNLGMNPSDIKCLFSVYQLW